MSGTITGVPVSAMNPSAYKAGLLIPAVDQSLPLINQNVHITAATLVGGPSGGQPYDIGFYVPSIFTSSQVLIQVPMARTVTYNNNFVPSTAYVNAASEATGSITIAIAKNGFSIGTLNFAASATNGTFTSSASSTSFNAGDILTITAPGTADATFSNLSVVFSGYRGSF